MNLRFDPAMTICDYPVTPVVNRRLLRMPPARREVWNRVRQSIKEIRPSEHLNNTRARTGQPAIHHTTQIYIIRYLYRHYK